MELLYIWIEDYKNIKRQGFNFSPLHDFEFIVKDEKDGKVISGELIDNIKDDVRAKRESHYKDFFGEGISNVTAIVGENGSGKSSVLEIVNKLFSDYGDSPREESAKAFLVYSDSNSLAIHHNFNIIVNPFFNAQISINLRITNQRFLFRGVKSKAYYYSPYPSFSTILFGKEDENISPLAQSIIKPTYVENFYPPEEIKEKTRRNKQAFLITLIRHYAEIKINIPEQTIIEFDYLKVSNEKMKVILDKFPIDENANFYQQMIDNLKKAIFVKLHLHNYSEQDQILLLKNFLENKCVIPSYQDVSDSLIQQNIFVEGTNKIRLTKESLLALQKMIKAFDTLGLGTFKDFFTIECDEIKLSQGQELYLNLIASVYENHDGFHSQDVKVTGTNNLLLLLDEPDLGLHPQWQKGLLKNLTDSLPLIFPDTQIQLIITSHSPFVVSDLPKENVIFLEKDANGNCQVSDLEKHKATFGANIHTLFTDSFFMKGGLIGDFAAEKINEAINILENTEPLNTEKIQFCEFIIGIIGEPILKRQLQKMLDSKRLQKIDKHENEIDELKKRIAELELKTKNL